MLNRFAIAPLSRDAFVILTAGNGDAIPRKIKKINQKMIVGARAPVKIPPGDTSLLKYFFSMATPAGLGALAMIVRPPPHGPQLDGFKSFAECLPHQVFIHSFGHQLRDIAFLQSLSDFVGTLLDFFSTALIVLCCASTAAAGSAASAGSVNKKSRAGTNNSMMDPIFHVRFMASVSKA
jgi:hypothetical protein